MQCPICRFEMIREWAPSGKEQLYQCHHCWAQSPEFPPIDDSVAKNWAAQIQKGITSDQQQQLHDQVCTIIKYLPVPAIMDVINAADYLPTKKKSRLIAALREIPALSNAGPLVSRHSVYAEFAEMLHTHGGELTSQDDKFTRGQVSEILAAYERVAAIPSATPSGLEADSRYLLNLWEWLARNADSRDPGDAMSCAKDPYQRKDYKLIYEIYS